MRAQPGVLARPGRRERPRREGLRQEGPRRERPRREGPRREGLRREQPGLRDQPSLKEEPGRALPANEVLLGCLVTVLTVIGLVMVLSASSVASLRQYGSSWVYFEHQLLWVAIGAVALVGVSRVDYRLWRRLSGPSMAACVVLLLAVLVPHVGVRVGGSSRWLGSGSFRVQPSELAKLALAVFGADVLARRAARGRPWWPAVRPVLVAFFAAGGLILAQPDMGTALVLGVVTVGLLYAAGAPARLMGGVLAGSGLLSYVLGMAMPYRRARLLSFLDPWAHRTSSGYQVVQSLVGFADGHFVGVGLGASKSKFGYLPNAHTDFIFSVIGAELGLVGSLLVVALFVALAVVGVRVAARAPDRFGSLLACAVTCWLTGQAVLNMGAVIGMLPVTGVPLPFVSFGGSSLVIELAAVGILLNVARQGTRQASTPAGRRPRP